MQAKENHNYKAVQMEMGEMKTKLEGFKALETENKKLNLLILEKDKEVKNLQKQIEDEQNEKLELAQVRGISFPKVFLRS